MYLEDDTGGTSHDNLLTVIVGEVADILGHVEMIYVLSLLLLHQFVQVDKFAERGISYAMIKCNRDIYAIS